MISFNMGSIKAQLKRHEGLRLRAYQDSKGVWTVGYGRNLQELTVTKGMAEQWLKEDIEQASEELWRAFPVVDKLSEKRQRVLINMCFNMGTTRLGTFRKMWKAIKRRDFYSAAQEMEDSKWYMDVGEGRADELINMMLSG